MRRSILGLSWVAMAAALGCGGSLYEPDGRPDVRALGPSGGEVGSRDGRFRLVLPPGALEKTTTIAVSPVTMQGSLGGAYLVEPEGLGLAAPAAVEIDQGPADGYRLLPAVARRTSAGGWEIVAGGSWAAGTATASPAELGVFGAVQPPCTGSSDCVDGLGCMAGSCSPCLGAEVCGDGLDNDCNGTPDDGCGPASCRSREGCGASEQCVGGQCVPCAAQEVCGNGIDDECNGKVDDGCRKPCAASLACPGGESCDPASRICVASGGAATAMSPQAAGCGASQAGGGPVWLTSVVVGWGAWRRRWRWRRPGANRTG